MNGRKMGIFLSVFISMKTYELRFISSSVDVEGDGYKWDGTIFCRHGNVHHKSWWTLNRNNKRFIQTKSGNFDGIDRGSIDVCVYVISETQDMNTLMNDLMSYIGRQTKINCSCHKLPLITNKDKMRNVITSPPKHQIHATAKCPWYVQT